MSQLKTFDLSMVEDITDIHKLLEELIASNRNNPIIIIAPASDKGVEIVEVDDEKIFDLEGYVTKMLHKIGVPCHKLGYKILHSAIVLLVENEKMRGNISKELYPLLSDQYNSTPSRIEHAIRSIKMSMWHNGIHEELREILEYYAIDSKKPPRNKVFMMAIAKTTLRDLMIEN
ncbi:MAG: sporulation initiation factor Spo0A C-terminal domain-containing protein [Lachnospiraceae bacterium]|jgi:two-component system response regulator (stage 0 sporulation protein A)|nr:sporulation initiation factor Spo0A C-terminal domain-containing protein [Lachnospiraceae bacterium]